MNKILDAEIKATISIENSLLLSIIEDVFLRGIFHDLDSYFWIDALNELLFLTLKLFIIFLKLEQTISKVKLKDSFNGVFVNIFCRVHDLVG